MPSVIESAIASVFAKQNQQLVNTWREIKAKGGKKSECASQILKATRKNLFMRNGLLILLDSVWKES